MPITQIPPDIVPATTMTQAISFLVKHTHQDEAEILAAALRSGLELLYRQVVEQGYVDGSVSQREAEAVLGAAHVAEIDYAKQALLADIRHGLDA